MTQWAQVTPGPHRCLGLVIISVHQNTSCSLSALAALSAINHWTCRRNLTNAWVGSHNGRPIMACKIYVPFSFIHKICTKLLNSVSLFVQVMARHPVQLSKCSLFYDIINHSHDWERAFHLWLQTVSLMGVSDTSYKLCQCSFTSI